MKFTTVVLCFATAALGMPTGADVGAAAAADKQLGGKGAAAGNNNNNNNNNKGTPAAGLAQSSGTATNSAAVPSATVGKGNGNGNGKGGNGSNQTGAISESVIPDYGLAAGVPSKSQPGSCVGANGINIPCTCPPPKAEVAAALTAFVARGKAGSVPVSFPDPSAGGGDTSLAGNRARINAIVNTLQNFNFDRTGRTGDGCPAASFPALAAVQKRLQGGENVQVGGLGLEVGRVAVVWNVCSGKMLSVASALNRRVCECAFTRIFPLTAPNSY
ncbi:hypothetical protein PG997_011955 [Apiospora hydei]|uniref:Uncharacterized protein n=1 Tax=Apiospora hydei TaxID=1337664 RepID=A0ABR1V5C7_9PEZI